MNKNLQPNINETLLPKKNTSSIYYYLSSIIIFLIIALFLIYFDVGIKFPSLNNKSKSKEQLVADIFLIIFFSMLVVGLSVMFLPSAKEFKDLFEQINAVVYVIIYTIFAILFYTLMPSNILNNYANIINPAMLLLGGFSFYKSFSENYIEKFNVNYERIKMILMLFCFITLIITLFNINPGNIAEKYFGYSLLLTILIGVFAFLYLIILLTLPGEEGKKSTNLFSNFSSFGVYGTISFALFLILMTSLIASDKTNFFSNKDKSAGVLILMLMICILWVVLLSSNALHTGTGTETSNPNMKWMNNSLLVLFGLIVSGLLIYWITYNIENLSGGYSSITSFILNLILVAIILGLIYKTIYVKLPTKNANKNAFFNLLLQIMLYIPCLIGNVFDSVGKMTTGSENSGSFMMLLIAIILIVAYFKTPSIFNMVNTQGGNQLVNKPVYTDTMYSLGNYSELNGGSDEFDYQYAISCWIFLDSAPPNTNPSYTKYTSLLNFNEKPNILYNSSKNSLMVTMQQKDLKNTTNNDILDFDDNGNRIIFIEKNVLLQKWNNIIINYNGGTMDIFLNGELMKSSIGVVPYYTIDNLTIGENDGIKGGICNVVYFRRALNSSNIYYIYNTVKNKSPPILNDSNTTITKQNIETTINAIK